MYINNSKSYISCWKMTLTTVVYCKRDAFEKEEAKAHVEMEALKELQW